MAAVVRLAGIEDAIQKIIHLQKGSDGSHSELLELPQVGGRDIFAILLGLELDFDAHLAQLIHGQLEARGPGGRIARMMIQRGSEAFGIAGLSQQALGFLTIESHQIFRLGRVQLLRIQPPLWQGTRDGPGDEAALAEFQRLQPRLPIDRQGEGAPHPYVVEGGLIRAHVEHAPVQVLVLEKLQLGVGRCSGIASSPASSPVVCTKSTFPVRSRDDPRGVVGGNLPFDAIDVG